jgi:hypothetical protein
MQNAPTADATHTIQQAAFMVVAPVFVLTPELAPAVSIVS